MNKPNEIHYFNYWGKSGSDANQDAPVHLLPYHCLDVAAVGHVLLLRHLALKQSLSQLIPLAPCDVSPLLGFLLALHDLGKFATSFQNLNPELLQSLQNRQSDRIYTLRHDSLGFAFWRGYLQPRWQQQARLPTGRQRGAGAWDYWLSAVTGHHGQPPELRAWSMSLDDDFETTDRNAALAYTDEVFTLFLGDRPTLPELPKHTARQASWWLAGFAVLCDWLGSNQDHFPFRNQAMALQDYWSLALEQAETAVAATELLPATPSKQLTLGQLIQSTSVQAAPLQQAAAELDLQTGPQLFILEDVTGAGKTEAALLLAHRLLQVERGSGIYFGLPTMATANGMHQRLGAIYRCLYADDSTPSLVLAHGARNLSATFRQSLLPEATKQENQYGGGEAPPATAHCSQWLGDHRKKALLAELGVGTIDQALLAVLPARHQSLRLLGLMGKVLVVDEVHACDTYMQRLLCSLLQAHACAGGSAILLSATLPGEQRQQLLDAFSEGLNTASQTVSQTAYPLLTQLGSTGLTEQALATRDQVRRRVEVHFTHRADELDALINQTVAAEQCICWICNTVADALDAWQQLKHEHPDWRVTLFHARFALADRLEIEQSVIQDFGKDSGFTQRRGRVLIATQVVEQSLDLDFDYLISDLAPMDLLIQRAGRLRRHRRDELGNPIDDPDRRGPPKLIVHAPAWSDTPSKDWYADAFPRAQAVYPNHAQLWLTQGLLQERGGFQMPDDARALIEGVYGEEAEPTEGLLASSNEALAQGMADASLARLNSLSLHEGYSREGSNHWWDEAMTPTRLGEPTSSVYLARWNGEQLLPWRNEPFASWQQSSLSLRTAQISATGGYAELSADLLEQCRQTLPAKGKWGVLLPLIRQPDGCWQGYGVNAKDEPVGFRYAPEHGLIPITQEKDSTP